MDSQEGIDQDYILDYFDWTKIDGQSRKECQKSTCA